MLNKNSPSCKKKSSSKVLQAEGKLIDTFNLLSNGYWHTIRLFLGLKSPSFSPVLHGISFKHNSLFFTLTQPSYAHDIFPIQLLLFAKLFGSPEHHL